MSMTEKPGTGFRPIPPSDRPVPASPPLACGRYVR